MTCQEELKFEALILVQHDEHAFSPRLATSAHSLFVRIARNEYLSVVTRRDWVYRDDVCGYKIRRLLTTQIRQYVRHTLQ